MKLEEVKRLLLNMLCEEFDNSGSASWVSSHELYIKLNGNKYVKQNGGIKRGFFEVSIDELFKEKSSLFRFEGERFRVSKDIYLNWLNSRQTKTDLGNEKDWEPLHVENYETVADDIDGVANSLEADNGYIAHYPLEAQHTITILKNLSSSLRDNKGVVIRKQWEHFVTLIERVLAIFDKTSRIGEAAHKLFVYISSLLS